MTDTELKFRGVAIEGWGVGRELSVVRWLETNFGKRAKKLWYIDYDYDLVTLIMREDVFALYLLKYES